MPMSSGAVATSAGRSRPSNKRMQPSRKQLAYFAALGNAQSRPADPKRYWASNPLDAMATLKAFHTVAWGKRTRVQRA